MTNTISIIASMAKNRVIGNKGTIPWHISEDLIRFNTVTTGHPIIMGVKTHESISGFENLKGWNSNQAELKHKLLPNRTNIILSQDPDYKVPGAFVVATLDEAIKIAKVKEGSEEIFLIGGGYLYKTGIEIADKIYLTLIDAEVEGDTYFPEIDPKIWRLENDKKRVVRVLDKEIVYYFQEYVRATKNKEIFTKEIKIYNKNKKDLLEKYKDKFIVIKSDEILASFSTQEEAYRAGLEKFGEKSFFIKQVMNSLTE
jgi:dihydrofolate reductase